MSERACLRGCTILDLHYASCGYTGPTYTGAFPCRGCAPRECRDGSMICDKCFGRARGLLNDGHDLLARLLSIADPSKATILDPVRVSSSTTEAPAPVGDDLLDAITAVRATVRSLEGADLTHLANREDEIIWLSHNVLDRHPPIDGIRTMWSMQDAADKWGVERRDKDTFVYPDEDAEEHAQPVHEWYDPLLTVKQAADRAKVDQRTVRRWVEKGIIEPVAKHRGPHGSVISYLRASAVDTLAEMNKPTKVLTGPDSTT